MKTVIDPVATALGLLRSGRARAAHVLLAEAYRKDASLEELGCIANLIEPCQLRREARRRLERLLDRRRMGSSPESRVLSPKS